MAAPDYAQGEVLLALLVFCVVRKLGVLQPPDLVDVRGKLAAVFAQIVK